MKKTTIIQTLLVSISIFMGSFYYINNNREKIFELALKNSEFCISIQAHNESELSLVYTNYDNFVQRNVSLDKCLDVICTEKGLAALYSLSEPHIVDAHINGDIEVNWNSDMKIFESQVINMHRMVFDGFLSFGWSFHKIMHVYTHYLSQYINSYSISYDWMDSHYSVSSDIIAAFIDSKYFLYSHGIGYSKTADIKEGEDPTIINLSKLSMDISIEQAAENKLEFVFKACNLKPGSKVLDVGSGWGSFPKYAIPLGVNVHALTVSTVSYKDLQILSNGFKHCDGNCSNGVLTVSLINFWELRGSALDTNLAGTYDAVVCIGTIEHLPHYKLLLKNAEYFLKPGGYLHVDGFGVKSVDFRVTNYFFHKYIFPGDSLPCKISSLMSAWEKSNLKMVSVHYDADNYANTIYKWAQKFEQLVRNESHPMSKIPKRSLKIFRLYLWGSLMAFTHPTLSSDAWRVVLQKAPY